MKVVVDVLDEQVEAVRQALGEAGWNDSPDQVRRVLRYTIAAFLTRWYRTRAGWQLRRFDEVEQDLKEAIS